MFSKRVAMMLAMFILAATAIANASVSSLADAPASRLAMLKRGLDIAHWFRFPPNNAAEAMRGDLDDAAIASLRRAGFTFIRLPVGPEEVMRDDHIDSAKRDAIVSVIGRLERAGLAVLVDPNPERLEHWNLERDEAARARLLGFWRDLAPALRHLPTGLTFPELVNEPLYQDAAQWDELQRQLLAVVRASLPGNTVILTGTDWSSINGLLKVQPVTDPDVIYSFHTYEPQLLALLGFWDPAINHKQLAQALPFPAADADACNARIASIADAHTRSVGKYWCSLHQDAGTVEANLDRAVSWGRTQHVSVAMTEFGATGGLNADARERYLAAVRRAAEHLGIPWGLWALDDQMGFDQRPGGYRSERQLSRSVMRALGLAQNNGVNR